MASTEISSFSRSAPSFAPAASPEDPRVDDAAQKAFDRAKPTRDYGLGGWLKYNALSTVSRWLTGDQQTKLDLYNKHAALRAGVVKVKTAYQNFITAEKAVQQAKDPLALKHAQAEEQRQAKRLMDTYNELIALAATQARELGVSEIAYKADLHKALNTTDSLIFYTLNRIAGRYCLPTSELAIADGFERSYVLALSNLVLNIQSAFTASGEQASVKIITEAFIEGLASLPEFAQDRLRVLDCYMALAKLRNPSLETDKAALEQLQEAKETLVKTIVADFLLQLNKLLDSDTEITMADIRKITSHGISLYQWRPLTEAEVNQLNNLREIKASLKQDKETLESNCNLIADSKQILEQEHDFEMREICEFLGFCTKGDRKEFLTQIARRLATVPDNDDLLGFNEFKKVITALAELEQKIADLNTEADREMKKFTDLQRKVTQLNQSIVQFKEAIATSLDEIASLEQELVEFKKQFQIVMGRLNEFNEKEKMEELLGDIIEKGQQKFSENIKKQEAVIDQKKAELQFYQSKIAQLQIEHDEASTALEEMEEVQTRAEARYSKSLLSLKEEHNKLAKTTLKLSGKTIGVIGEGLGIQTVPIFLTGANSIMASQLKTHLELSELNRERKVDDRHISELTRKVSATCSSLGLEYDETEQSFAFQPDERVQIQKFVDSNLDIAAEVTARLLDRGGQTRRQTDLRQLTNQSEEGTRFRGQMTGEGLYQTIASRIYSSRSPDENPEELGVENFDIGDDEVFAF